MTEDEKEVILEVLDRAEDRLRRILDKLDEVLEAINADEPVTDGYRE